MKLGVSLEALGSPFRVALSQAAKLGVGGVQWSAVGELAPDRLTGTGRREIQQLLRSHGLSLAGLACPLRRELNDATDLEARLARIRDVMSLSFELGARLVVAEPGRIPENDDTSAPIVESLQNLGGHGDRTGTVLALQTGLDAGLALAQLLNRIDTGGLGVSFHPANWLVHGFDPIAELPALSGRVGYVQANDALRNRANRQAAIVPLGHGNLDWLQLAGSLVGMEYGGWVVVESAGTATEVAAGVALLRRVI